MKYALRIGPDAERQLAAQPEPLQTFIYESLQRLGESPSSFSVRTDGPHRGQTAEFRYDRQPGISVWVTVRFLIGVDEETLHIERIVVEFGA
jgi:hypothetical protein